MLFLIAYAGCAFAALPAGWGTNFTTALSEAKARQKPVLVYFTASWCGPCKLMARTTLTNEMVIQTLTHFIPVAVDIDEHHDLAEKHGVRAVPTFQLLTTAGDEVAATTGYQDAGRFLQWLTKGISGVKAAVEHQQLFEEKVASVDQLLTQTDADSLRKAAAELIDLCAERGSAISEVAGNRLAALARRDPTLLLDGLNHPRLAARIHVANLLRAQLGEGFEADPWSDTATRQKAIAFWREKLADRKSTGRNSP